MFGDNNEQMVWKGKRKEEWNGENQSWYFPWRKWKLGIYHIWEYCFREIGHNFMK